MSQLLQPYQPKQRHIPKKNFIEDSIQRSVCHYLKLTYPSVIFRSDLDSGRNKDSDFEKHRVVAMNSSKSWPDLFIYQPREVVHSDGSKKFYSGLALELKADGVSVIMKIGARKGKLSTDRHIQEQAVLLKGLIKKGYYANFAVGMNEAIKIIDWYMGKPTNTELF